MEETVRTPGKSMGIDFFTQDILPKIKNDACINFMGGEPTIHPQFTEIFQMTLTNVQPFTSLGVFTNGLMSDMVLDLFIQTASKNGCIKNNINFALLLNWQTPENTSEKNHQRTAHVAETMLSRNGYSITFSLNLYSVNQELDRQCAEIDAIYQKVGLPSNQNYKIRVSPAFPIVGEGDANIYLPIHDYPRMGRKMLDILKRFPQLEFRFDCSFPPCFLDDIQNDEMGLGERFYYHGSQKLPPMKDWNNHHLYFGCADGSPMDIDSQGDCFNCFPFHNLRLGNVQEFKELNNIASAQMGAKFLNHVFEKTEVKEPCRSCPHYMVRCSSGCFSYNFVQRLALEESQTSPTT